MSAPTTPNIVNAMMYGTCAATGSLFTMTTIVPITANPKKAAKTTHGHRAGRVPARSPDDDTEHLDGLLAALHGAEADRLGRDVRRPGDGGRGRRRSPSPRRPVTYRSCRRARAPPRPSPRGGVRRSWRRHARTAVRRASRTHGCR